MEPSTGYTFRVEFTAHALIDTALKAGGVTQASFTCTTQDLMRPSWLQVVMANRAPLNSTYSAVFSEPVALCNGASSFTSNTNITMVFTGTLQSQLGGLVWSMDIPYGSSTEFETFVEILTNNLCDTAGNRLAVYGPAYPTLPWTIGHEPRVWSRQRDMMAGIAKLYDTDDDGLADMLVYPNTLPLTRPSPSIQVSNVVSQTQFLANCANDSWIPLTITCDVPTLFSFGLNYTLVSTENATAPTAFPPYATMAVGVSSIQTQTLIRPIVVSATSQLGATYIDIQVAGGMVPLIATLVGGSAFVFYDPSDTYYPLGYTDETSATARLLLSAPLDSTRFSSSPLYVSFNPDYEIPGNLGPQWKPVALDFPVSSSAIQPQRIVLNHGQRLDIWFHNYTGVQLSLDYLYTAGLNFTCASFSGPSVYNATELRFNVSNCPSTTSLFFNASKVTLLGTRDDRPRLTTRIFQGIYPTGRQFSSPTAGQLPRRVPALLPHPAHRRLPVRLPSAGHLDRVCAQRLHAQHLGRLPFVWHLVGVGSVYLLYPTGQCQWMYRRGRDQAGGDLLSLDCGH